MDKRILKFVAAHLNLKKDVGDYKHYVLFDMYMSANEEMLDYLFEKGYVDTAPQNTYKFTQKALDILYDT